MANHFRIRQDTDSTLGSGDPETGIKTSALEGSLNVEGPGTKNTTVRLTYSHEDVVGSRLEAQACYDDLAGRSAKFPGFAQTETLSEKFSGHATANPPLKIGDIGDVAVTAVWGLDHLHDEAVQVRLDGPTVVPEIA